MIYVKRDGDAEFPALEVGVYKTTEEFRRVDVHVAVAHVGGELIAVTGEPRGLESLRYARLFASAPDGLAAAELALAWIYDPDEPAETFERIATQFQRDTGHLRPGKDEHPAMGVDAVARERAWREWCEKRSREVRAALTAFVAKARAPT